MQARTQENEPLVSVIIPVYNAGTTIATAVHSVLRQTLTDIEVIIVDDASSDDSAAVAERLMAQDGRIQLLRNTVNRGQAAARNLAIRHARGLWVTPVDADDEITPHRLQNLHEAGIASEADLIADGVRFAGPLRPGTPRHLSASRGTGESLEKLYLEEVIRSDIPLNGLCSLGYLKPLMRRTFLEQWRLTYDEDLRFAEDLNLYVRCLLCRGNFVLHPQTYYIYNQTPVSASRDVRALPAVADQALVNNERIRCLAQHRGLHHLDGLLDDHRQRWSTVLWFNHLKLAVREGRIGDAVQMAFDRPSTAAGILRFARDRARNKRNQTDSANA